MQNRFLFLLLLLLITLLPACGNPAPETTDPAPADSPANQSAAPAVFNFHDCTFISAATLAELLGEGVAGATEEVPAFVAPGSCTKVFAIALEDGRTYRMFFDASPISPAELAKEMRGFEEDARDVPGLMKYEASAAAGTYLGTHVSQRRLYVLHPAAAHLITLSYDDRTAGGSQSPAESEARRQGAIRVLNDFLTP